MRARAGRERRDRPRARGLLGRGSVIASPYLWLLFFFLVPFAIVLKISVAEVQLAIPPYTPLFAGRRAALSNCSPSATTIGS